MAGATRAESDAVRFESPADVGRSVHSQLSVVGADAPVVVTFCKQFGLGLYLPQAIDSVARRFSPTYSVRVSVERDPEFSDEWMELDVTVDGDPDEISSAYDRYTKDWLASAPPHLWGRVRLSLNLES